MKKKRRLEGRMGLYRSLGEEGLLQSGGSWCLPWRESSLTSLLFWRQRQCRCHCPEVVPVRLHRSSGAHTAPVLPEALPSLSLPLFSKVLPVPPTGKPHQNLVTKGVGEMQ